MRHEACLLHYVLLIFLKRYEHYLRRFSDTLKMIPIEVVETMDLSGAFYNGFMVSTEPNSIS